MGGGNEPRVRRILPVSDDTIIIQGAVAMWEPRLEMGQEQDSQAYQRFVQQLRAVLNHLYEPDYLRRSPLRDLLGVADGPDAHAHLQRLLIDAIEALEPRSTQLAEAPARWIYEVLFDRYVQQLSQQEVADHLGVCVRHMRRRQRIALETLAARLWEQVQACTATRADVPAVSDEAGAAAPALDTELAWLETTPIEAPIALQEVLPSVLAWAGALADRFGTKVSVAPLEGLPPIAAHPVALRQMLLSMLSVALAAAPAGRAEIAAELRGQTVALRVHSATPRAKVAAPSNDGTADLEVAQRLAELSGGTLAVNWSGASFEAVVYLPAGAERVPVLAIDDNPDALQLLGRYTANTRYQLIGKRDPYEALQAAVDLQPAIVVLDVMMPQVEGWELLARLRQHPLTRHIPIVVCTVLSQKELALSLGARAFVRKPLTREQFLAVLDQQVGATQRAAGPG